MNIDTCIECGKPSVSVRLITGDDIDLWCKEHLFDARDSMLRFISKETQDIVFDANEHELWYWGADIQSGLSTVVRDFLTELASDLSADTEMIRVNADLVTIKAKEYRGAIEVPKQLRTSLAGMPEYWLGAPYVAAIGEPFGKKTADIIDEYSRKYVDNQIVKDLVCIVLAAKRAEGYVSHKHAERLIAIEEALWTIHRENLK